MLERRLDVDVVVRRFATKNRSFTFTLLDYYCLNYLNNIEYHLGYPSDYS